MFFFENIKPFWLLSFFKIADRFLNYWNSSQFWSCHFFEPLKKTDKTSVLFIDFLLPNIKINQWKTWVFSLLYITLNFTIFYRPINQGKKNNVSYKIAKQQQQQQQQHHHFVFFLCLLVGSKMYNRFFLFNIITFHLTKTLLSNQTNLISTAAGDKILKKKKGLHSVIEARTYSLSSCIW